MQHFTYTDSEGRLRKGCSEDAPPFARLAAKAIILKRDDDDPPSETEILHTLDDELRRAFRGGRLPIASDGPASQKLLLAVHHVSRESPHLTSSAAYAEAWAELSEADRSAVIEEEKQALADRLAAEREEKESARARSFEEVGKRIAEMDIIKSAKAVIAGEDVGLTKGSFHRELERRAAEYRKDHPALTPEQAYALIAIETPEGKVLFKAYGLAPADPPPVVKRSPPTFTGAAAEIERLVAAHRKANPKSSYAASFTAVYTSPEHSELKAKYDEESTRARQTAVVA